MRGGECSETTAAAQAKDKGRKRGVREESEMYCVWMRDRASLP